MKSYLVLFLLTLASMPGIVSAQTEVHRFGFHESSFEASGNYRNPYTDLQAVAEIKRPDGKEVSAPLFWNGGKSWKLRISPHATGKWSYTLRSNDPGLNGKHGVFTCVASDLPGSIEAMKDHPHHFQRQNGTPFLFWGDTAWGLYLDKEDEALNRESVFRYIDKRANEGINVAHSMLLSEAGWGNNGGAPFEDIGAEELNPAYWQEVDLRLKYLNEKNIIGGLVIAWGDKGRDEPYSWHRFPSLEARKRYARYIAARYSAYHVYFIISGEWNGEAINRKNMNREEVRAEFIEIGNVLAEADIHDRMIGMHPMTAAGSVREFNEADWMSFGDYQQNYTEVHQRILDSRSANQPVVNAEYGYYLRDSSFDGKVDKHNSFTPQDMRYTTWDILMAGGYPVTGYGTTYMGGYRDPGPFNPEDPRNLVWTAQYHLAQHFLSQLEWWKLEPHDKWISTPEFRSADREIRVRTGPDKSRAMRRPPLTAYWLLAQPGMQYIAYGRGVENEITITLGEQIKGDFYGSYGNPRTGVIEDLGRMKVENGALRWKPPVTDDWVLTISRFQ